MILHTYIDFIRSENLLLKELEDEYLSDMKKEDIQTAGNDISDFDRCIQLDESESVVRIG